MFRLLNSCEMRQLRETDGLAHFFTNREVLNDATVVSLKKLAQHED